ncbi:MAG: Fe-S protein assembly co-chaperone HscB [Buchnera aphidicola (Schlechtendalia peitan)]
MNYFKLFNFPQKFKIDIKQLSLQFYKLQKIYHPDVHENCLESKNKDYYKHSININKGYHILKDPLKRAKHLLLLNSFNFNNEQKNLSNEKFIYEQLKLFETLEMLKNNIQKKKELKLFLHKIEQKKKSCFIELEFMFDKEEWQLAAMILYKLLFYEKLT